MLTEITATAGAVLGIFNTVWQFMRTRTRLRVAPGFSRYGTAFSDDGQTDIVIKVINLSEFPVKIEEAGIMFTNGDLRPLKFTQTFHRGRDTDSRELPITLAARDSVELKSYEQDGIRASLILSSYPAKCAYVRTASGYVKTGWSKELRGRVAGARPESPTP